MDVQSAKLAAESTEETQSIFTSESQAEFLTRKASQEASQEASKTSEKEDQNPHSDSRIHEAQNEEASDEDSEERKEGRKREQKKDAFVHVSEISSMRKQISFCISSLRNNEKITLGALGKNIPRLISIAEILKTRIGWLHQVTNFTSN